MAAPAGAGRDQQRGRGRSRGGKESNGRGGGAPRSRGSPGPGQVRAVEDGGWGEAAQVQDGVSGWGLEGHPDGEGVMVRYVAVCRLVFRERRRFC